ncbi:ATP-binding protein [Streptomyces sp. NPDC004393]|uniref:ATP-binding protein n=1 Tax=Streptomyces sp. NPDC004533 TaxID=3154278 RepID=UPI0033BA0231
MNTESDGARVRLRTWRLRFTPTPRHAVEARRGAGCVLRSWGVPDEARETVELVVSELATNAVRHGRVPGRYFEVAMAYDGEKTVDVEVSDACARLPVPADPDPESTSGCGLLLVAALSESWGVRDRGVGKTVWARILF